MPIRNKKSQTTNDSFESVGETSEKPRIFEMMLEKNL